MPDFPAAIYREMPLANISTHGPSSLIIDCGFPQGASAALIAYPSANLGCFYPVMVERTVTVYKMSVIIGTQSGNVDVGIYDENGVAIVRAGATAVGAAGMQVFDIADTTLTPNVYWWAIACDNTTATFRGCAGNGLVQRGLCCAEVVSAYSSGLITPVTYGAWNNNRSFMPMITAHMTATV